jgi:hypothetical protein
MSLARQNRARCKISLRMDCASHRTNGSIAQSFDLLWFTGNDYRVPMHHATGCFLGTPREFLGATPRSGSGGYRARCRSPQVGFSCNLSSSKGTNTVARRRHNALCRRRLPSHRCLVTQVDLRTASRNQAESYRTRSSYVLLRAFGLTFPQQVHWRDPCLVTN